MTNNPINPTASTSQLNDQIGVILSSLAHTRNTTYFAGNILKLSREQSNYENRFFNDPRVKDGFGELIEALMNDLDHLIGCLKELGLCDFDKADGVHQMNLAYEQVYLLSCLIAHKDKCGSECSNLGDYSSYCLIFDEIYSNMAALHSHFKTYRDDSVTALSESDCENIAAIAQQRFDIVMSHWLPAGRYDEYDYVARNLKSSEGKHWSLAINIASGHWFDFAMEKEGGDLVSLVAHLEGVTQSKAARMLASFLSIDLASERGAA